MRYLLVLLALCFTAAHAKIENMQWVDQTDLDFVCEVLLVDCSALGIAPPLLIVADIGGRGAPMGLYPIATNVVVVDDECMGRLADKEYCRAILIHEVTHYVSYMLWPEITRCESEQLAWGAYNEYVVEIKRSKLLRWNWRKDYPKCQEAMPFSAPTLPEMSGSYALQRTDDIELVRALHTICMPGDHFDLEGQLWVCYDDTGTPVGFCAARKLEGEPGVFLNRAGVLPCANGHKLQQRMIRARLRWAKEVGAKYVITYTLYGNHASIVNLLRCDFRFDIPNWKWAGDVHYFAKDLT